MSRLLQDTNAFTQHYSDHMAKMSLFIEADKVISMLECYIIHVSYMLLWQLKRISNQLLTIR